MTDDPAPTNPWADEAEEDDGPPPLPAGADLAPGYRVVGLLRRGEDLDVYDLWSEERACRCVGKTLRPDRLGDASARRRLLREGRLLARLAHPHLVRGYETLPGPPPVVVLETLPGETLAHLIDAHERRLPLVQVAHLGLHLCSAVHYLHRQNVLHLDLKPSNVVASNGIAKVLDLSLARAPGRTRGGYGTPGYMPPEQARGGIVGPPADVWGIGGVLFEAVTAEPPCETEETSAGGDQTDRPPDPVRRHRRLPPPFADLVDRCLDPDPARRPSVADLSDALVRFV